MQLYFAGAHHKFYHDYLKERGARFLLSYVNDLKALERYMREGEGLFFVDSGAFTAHRKGIEIDVDKYIAWLNDHDTYIHIAAQIDTIPGRFGEVKTPGQLYEAPRLSWDNYCYMRDRVKHPEKILPIFHQGEDFTWLLQMLAEKVPYIGISPANDVVEAEKEAWLDECWRLILDSDHAQVKTHAFGMTNLRLMEQYPFESADSTTWLINSVYGNISTRFGILSISTRKQEVNPKHIWNQPEAIQQVIKADIESMGYTLEELELAAKKRAMYNADFFLAWARGYHYRPKLMRQRTLF